MSDTKKKLKELFAEFLTPEEAIIAADLHGGRDPLLAVKSGMSIRDLDLMDEY
jgi:hypothetical protein